MLARLIILAFIAGCVGPAPRDLDDLSVLDSLYVDPATAVPYTGAVVRGQPGVENAIQIEGRLLDGVWEGELTVYHPNGRVRYRGAFLAGQRCGAWIENADSVPPINLYDELVREIESMALYTPC